MSKLGWIAGWSPCFAELKVPLRWVQTSSIGKHDLYCEEEEEGEEGEEGENSMKKKTERERKKEEGAEEEEEEKEEIG